MGMPTAGKEFVSPAIFAPEPARPSVIRIPPSAYLRSVWSLVWGAIRYPFRTTIVDLTTGKSVHLP